MIYYKDDELVIRNMEEGDARILTDEYAAQGWHPDIATYHMRLKDQEEGKCAVVVQKVREGKGDFGYNARTDQYEDMRKAGIVDPAKVARVALENAASIAGMFLTTECLICDKPEKEPAMPMGGAPGMGGMM